MRTFGIVAIRRHVGRGIHGVGDFGFEIIERRRGFQGFGEEAVIQRVGGRLAIRVPEIRQRIHDPEGLGVPVLQQQRSHHAVVDAVVAVFENPCGAQIRKLRIPAIDASVKDESPCGDHAIVVLDGFDGAGAPQLEAVLFDCIGETAAQVRRVVPGFPRPKVQSPAQRIAHRVVSEHLAGLPFGILAGIVAVERSRAVFTAETVQVGNQ